MTRDERGERDFGGFAGALPPEAFADCLLDATALFPGDKEGNASCQADAIYDGAQWLVCGTLGLAFPSSAESILSLADRFSVPGKRICVDVNWRPVFWPDVVAGRPGAEDAARNAVLDFASRADVVKLTDEEAEWLLGIPPDRALENPSVVAESFPDADAVLVTGGERGAAYSVFGHCGRVEPFIVKVKETTGAGDSFTAGFLHALLSLGGTEQLDSGFSLDERPLVIKDMLRFASAAGALTCTNEGAIAAQPSFDEVESFLIHGEKVWR